MAAIFSDKQTTVVGRKENVFVIGGIDVQPVSHLARAVMQITGCELVLLVVPHHKRSVETGSEVDRSGAVGADHEALAFRNARIAPGDSAILADRHATACGASVKGMAAFRDGKHNA